MVGSRSQVVRQYRRLQVVLAHELSELSLPETDATYRLTHVRTLARSHERAYDIDPGGTPKLVAVNA